MGSLNKVILIGTLGRDPEVRQTRGGSSIVSLSLATSESWKDKETGEKKERTEWHRVSIFNENLAKIAEQYLKKGSQVYLEGQLQTRKYTGKEGVEKYSTEVVLSGFNGTMILLGGNSERDNSAEGGASKRRNVPSGVFDAPEQGDLLPIPPSPKAVYTRSLDDEIPF